jgi:hypothetical protein
VRQASAIDAQANSNVNADADAALMVAVSWTATPALTRLLPSASPMTPAGHAVQTCRNKKAPGGHFRSIRLKVTTVDHKLTWICHPQKLTQ